MTEFEKAINRLVRVKVHIIRSNQWPQPQNASEGVRQVEVLEELIRDHALQSQSVQQELLRLIAARVKELLEDGSQEPLPITFPSRCVPKVGA